MNAQQRTRALAYWMYLALKASRRDRSEEGRIFFIVTQRDRLAKRLRAIGALPENSHNRFVCLSVLDKPGYYVQCLAFQGGLLCEAASGFYEKPGDSPLNLDAAALAALDRLEFTRGDGAKGNYQRLFKCETEQDRFAVADTMLELLYEVYGARSATEVEWT